MSETERNNSKPSFSNKHTINLGIGFTGIKVKKKFLEEIPLQELNGQEHFRTRYKNAAHISITMAKETEREEIKEETHELEDEAQDELEEEDEDLDDEEA